jgi:penicillin-binding protein 2
MKVKIKFKEELEIQDIFLDRLAQRKEQKERGLQKRIEHPFQGNKIWRFLFFVFAVFLILFGRTFQIQVIEGKKYSQLSTRNQFLVRSIESRRGIIYDRNLNQLVQNKDAYNLMCNPAELPVDENTKKQLIESLSILIDVPRDELTEKINQASESSILIKKNISYETLLCYRTQSQKWPGFFVERKIVRNYNEGASLAHILGYVSYTEQVGEAGLEKSYNETLQEQLGQIKIEKDAQGREISQEIISNPQPGHNLVLSLDLPLQEKIEQVLRQQIEEVGALVGNAVALDPRTGEVLAIVSIPSYNNNAFSQGISSKELKNIENNPQLSLFNQAISGVGYPTGSIIKPIIGIAALEEKVITPQTKIYCPEKICVANRYTGGEQCFRDWKFHGISDIYRAIAESINPFFYAIGGGYKEIKGLGAKKIKTWLERFGWGEKTGIDLPEEGKGVLPSLDGAWYLGDTYHLSIGQGPFAATPLQVAFAFSAIANGGTLYQPKIVKEITENLEEGTRIVEEKKPIVINPQVASQEVIQVLREGMRQAVANVQGSAHILNNLNVEVAAKTGTAQTGQEEYYHNWIVAFAPYQNPEIVLVLMIKDVPEQMVAVRGISRDILEWFFMDHYDKLDSLD